MNRSFTIWLIQYLMRRGKLYAAFVFFILLNNISFGQQQQYCMGIPSFRNYVFTILEDSTNYWSTYPKPPKVTDSVLCGMEKEIMADDSAKYFLEHLSFKKYKWAIDYWNAFYYIHKMDYNYTLLALTAHWNPDLRVAALLHLNKKLNERPKVNSRKMKTGEWKKFDKTAIVFLVYLAESNPMFISGSENATIHSIYISNILWSLDVLTGEQIVGNKNIRDWYKNDLQLETAILKWKTHLK